MLRRPEKPTRRYHRNLAASLGAAGVVHLVRNALRYASKKHWGAISADLRGVYTAPTVEAAETRFEEFRQRWNENYPAMIAV